MSSGDWAGAFMVVLVVFIIIAGMAYHDTLEASKNPITVCIDSCRQTCILGGVKNFDFFANTTDGCECRCSDRIESK